jgi:hypothetical protein
MTDYDTINNGDFSDPDIWEVSLTNPPQTPAGHPGLSRSRLVVPGKTEVRECSPAGFANPFVRCITRDAKPMRSAQ